MSYSSRVILLSTRLRACFLLGMMALLLSPPGFSGTLAVELETLASGLTDIVAITHAGDDRLFLSDKGGFIRIFDGSDILATPFLDISSLTSFGLERGLLSVAFHPNYAINGYFFVFYTDNSNDPVIARYEVTLGDANQADPNSGVTLLNIPHFGGHYGGQLQFGPDGYLYFSLGDGGQQEDPSCRAQNESLWQGKLFRIDVDQNVNTPPYYSVPSDNPFVGPGDPPDEVWAVGFRNPWRFSFDSASGDLFISDVGQYQREEVTVQPATSSGGENYGWKIMEGSFCFDPDPIDVDCPQSTPSCFDASFVPPTLEYDHSGGNCSITGGYVYRGANIPTLDGHYLYGDWCSGNLWAANSEAGPWITELLNISLSGLTTFGEGVDGEVYLSDAVALFRLSLPGAIFDDGFEAGDVEAWSSASP